MIIGDDDYDDNDDDDDDELLQLGPGRQALQQQVLQAHGGHPGQADMGAMFNSVLKPLTVCKN